LRKHDSQAARNAMRDHLGRVIDGLLAATETDALDSARKRPSVNAMNTRGRLAI